MDDSVRNKKEGLIVIAVSIIAIMVTYLTSEPTICGYKYGFDIPCSDFLMTAISQFGWPLRKAILIPLIITIYGILRSQSLIRRLFGEYEKDTFDFLLGDHK